MITLAVTRVGNTFRLEGFDDQCGGATQASAIGTAFFNVNGTVGIGLSIVQTPGGAPAHVDATINTGNFNGTWRDSAGNTGNFTFTPGAGSGGSPRPLYSRAAFVHTVTAGSQAGDCTRLLHPLLDNQPTAILQVTHQFVPGYLNKVYSLFYSVVTDRWFVCTPGGVPPPVGHKFHVVVFRQ